VAKIAPHPEQTKNALRNTAGSGIQRELEDTLIAAQKLPFASIALFRPRTSRFFLLLPHQAALATALDLPVTNKAKNQEQERGVYKQKSRP
jgi:hypothetical protein